MSGLTVASEIRMSHPETRIIALMDSSERDTVVGAFRSGATGILPANNPLIFYANALMRFAGAKCGPRAKN
jgi:DNA-binding NarL/FixJ family response regulator